MQELIDILINERNQFIKMNPNQPIMDVGVKIFDVAISNAESMLEKEKEVMCEFAEEYVGSCLIDYPKIKIIFDQTFNN